MENKAANISSILKSALNLLRNSPDQIIGEDALIEISRMVILKQIEPQIISGNIDIYNLDQYPKDVIEMYETDEFAKMLELAKFSELAKYSNDSKNGDKIFDAYNGFVCGTMLVSIPEFTKVFRYQEKSKISSVKTLLDLISIVNKLELSDSDYDTLGDAYEKIFIDAVYGAGKITKSSFGQFFTPPKIKKILIDLVNPKIKESGEIESVLDPAAGTGGLLISIIKRYRDLGAQNLREQVMKKVSGIEIDKKIFGIFAANILINSGVCPPGIINSDSIRKFHPIPADIIVANPPFSLSMDYNEMRKMHGRDKYAKTNNIKTQYTDFEKYIPIDLYTKNSEMMFLQMILYNLNVGGRGAIIILNGEKLFSPGKKSQFRTYVGKGKIPIQEYGLELVRKYLLKLCDVHEVIICPKGTFETTSVETCILYFTKKAQCSDIIKFGNMMVLEKMEKLLWFCDEYNTKEVQFYQLNDDLETKTLLKLVPIDVIIKNNHSLSFGSYKGNFNINSSSCQVMTIRDVCEINPGKPIENMTKEENYKEGLYPVYGGGDAHFYVNQWNRENKIIVAKGTLSLNCVRYITNKFFLNSTGWTLTPNMEIINEKYLYYYLLISREKILKLGKGAGNRKSITKEAFYNFPIVVPPMEKQESFAKWADNRMENKKKMDEYYKFKYDMHYGGMVQEIGLFRDFKYTGLTMRDICIIETGKPIGTMKKEKEYKEGLYPAYGGGDTHFYVNEWNRENKIIVAKSGQSKKCVRYIKEKFFLNVSGWTLLPNIDIINEKYLYYYLLGNENEIFNLKIGADLKNMNMEAFYNFPISLPSLELQSKLTDKWEKMYEKSKKYLNRIDNAITEIGEMLKDLTQ